MPTKPSPKKKAATHAPAKRATPSIGTMKGGVAANRITVGRDFINGPQYNDYRRQLAQINTPQALVAELQKAQAQLAEIKHAESITPAEVRRIEAVEGDVQEAIEEAQKPKPLGQRINDTLIGATTTMETLGKSLVAATALGGTLAMLGQIAIKLFGG